MSYDYECPDCGAAMKLRSGRFGPFYGCVRYPDCTATRNEAGVPKASRGGARPPVRRPAEPPPGEAAPDLEVEDTTSRAATIDQPEVAPGMNEGGIDLPGLLPIDVAALPPRTLKLDEHQAHVVGWRHGSALVAAGAGSGKSTVLIERCASLLADGVLPEHIVTLVFNSAAGKQLAERLVARLGADVGGRMVARTFHGWAYGVLRGWEPRNPSYQKGRIIGTDDGPNGYQMAMRAAKRLDLMGDVGVYITASGQIREALIDLHDEDAVELVTNLRISGHREEVAARLVAFAREYQKEKEAARAIDFADMLYKVGREIEQRTGRAMKLAEQYQHVQVDEAQDINVVRMVITRHLASQAKSLICVGDLRQSIYGFTGARPDLFKGLLDDGATLLTLPVNRRSTAAVVNAGNVVAAGRDWNLGGECSPAETAAPGEPVMLWTEVGTEAAEGEMVAEEIKARVEEGLLLADASGKANYACLVRTNAQAAGLEAALVTRGLPVRVLGTSGGVWTTTMGREVIAYLAAAEGTPNDDVTKIANKPVRFLKNDDVKQALQAHRSGQDFHAALKLVARFRSQYKPERHGAYQFSEDLAVLGEAGWKERCVAVCQFLKMDLQARAAEDEAGEALAAQVKPDEDKVAMYEALCAAAAELGSLDAITEQIKDVKANEGEPAVEISTIHKSKGAEWTVVFVCGVAEECLPHGKAEDIEEERRLFYVALTRAKQTCIVSGGAKPSGFFVGLHAALAPPPPEPPPAKEPAPLLSEHATLVEAVEDQINQEEAAMTEEAGESPAAAGEPVGAVRPTVPPTLRARLDRLRIDLAEWKSIAEEVTEKQPKAAASGPGSRFVEITALAMADLLEPLGFGLAGRDVTMRACQQVYELGLPSDRYPDSYVVVRVYTTIPLSKDQARDLGEDSMKVAALRVGADDKARPLHQKLPHACRTRGWRISLLSKISEVLRVIEEKDAFTKEA